MIQKPKYIIVFNFLIYHLLIIRLKKDKLRQKLTKIEDKRFRKELIKEINIAHSKSQGFKLTRPIKISEKTQNTTLLKYHLLSRTTRIRLMDKHSYFLEKIEKKVSLIDAFIRAHKVKILPNTKQQKVGRLF